MKVRANHHELHLHTPPILPSSLNTWNYELLKRRQTYDSCGHTLIEYWSESFDYCCGKDFYTGAKMDLIRPAGEFCDKYKSTVKQQLQPPANACKSSFRLKSVN